MAVAGRALALFDFDNTLSICDSFLPFILFVAGPFKFSTAIFRLLVRRISGPVSRREAKQILVKATLQGLSVVELSAASQKFAKIFLANAMNNLQLQKLTAHSKAGDRIIIVSASLRLYLEEFAKNLGTELIATELVENQGILTGEIQGQNCRGPQKVVKIKELLEVSDYQAVSAYGDSDGDTEMLQMASSKIYRGGRDGFYSVHKLISCIILYSKCLLK